jgi:hypothetical protein
MGQSKEKHIRLALVYVHKVLLSAHAVKLRALLLMLSSCMHAVHPGTMFCSGQLMMGAWWLICVCSRTCIGKSFEDTHILRADQFCYVSCHKKRFYYVLSSTRVSLFDTYSCRTWIMSDGVTRYVTINIFLLNHSHKFLIQLSPLLNICILLLVYNRLYVIQY